MRKAVTRANQSPHARLDLQLALTRRRLAGPSSIADVELRHGKP